MMVPPLSTRTTATVQAHPLMTQEGSMALVVVIKQTFFVHDDGAISRVPGARIHIVDDPFDPDDPNSSIRYPSDVSLHKPGADVVVVGEAVSLGERPVPSVDVSVQVGALRKQLRVFGTRVWYKALGQLGLSEPLPFARKAITWEEAWGGIDDPRNPSGKGAVPDVAELVGQQAPSVEDPAHLIRSPKTKPPPAGLCALGPHFVPRRNYAGTMDQKWQEERMPLRPTDFDARFFQVAAPGLVAPAPFRGGEAVRIEGMHETGPMEFALPRAYFGVSAEVDHAEQEYRAVLDTVIVEPGTRNVDLVWRSVVPLPSQSNRMTGIQVWEKEAA